MSKRGPSARIVAVGLILCLQAMMLPVLGGQTEGAISGAIVNAETHQPIAGARLHVGNPTTGKIYTSDATRDDGAFVVSDLPAAGYELAVESGERLFVVGSPVEIAPGQSRSVQVAVRDDRASGLAPAQTSSGQSRSFWNNPLTAALVVVGSAIVVGLGVEALTNDNDEEPTGSNFLP